MRYSLYIASVFLTCYLLFIQGVLAQRTIPFKYSQTNGEDAEVFSGTVDVSLIQIRPGESDYNFSQVPNPIILEVAGSNPGSILIRFENVKFDKGFQHRNNELAVRASLLRKQASLSSPRQDMIIDGKNGSVGELQFPIQKNGAGRWTIYFDVDSKDGRITQRAGKISIGQYRIRYPQAAWNAARAKNSCADVKAFLQDYPESQFQAQAVALKNKLCYVPPPPDREWDICIANPSKECLERYLDSDAHSLAALQALERLSEAAWTKARTSNLCTAYRDFLRVWNKGEYQSSYVPEAELRLGSCTTPTPPPVTRDTTEEQRAWFACRDATDTTQIGQRCMDYLDTYGEKGLYRERAIQRLPSIDILPFTRNPYQPNVFSSNIKYAVPPIRLTEVRIAGGDTSQIEDITQDNPQTWRYLGDILKVTFKDRKNIEVVTKVGQIEKYEITISDASERKNTFIIDATRAPLEVTAFSEEEEFVSFTLVGGRPPYIARVVETGTGATKWQMSLPEGTSTAKVAKFDMDPDRKLRGAYKVMFLDERRTETVEAPQTIELDGDRSYLWLILLILEIGGLVWLYFIFSSRQRAYG
ncbi:MAG: hypothetical protein AAF587_20390 [Bacteroidota bacterium]